MCQFLIKYGMYNLKEYKRHKRIIISLLVLTAIVLIAIIFYSIDTIVRLKNIEEFNRQTIAISEKLIQQDAENAEKIKQEKDNKFSQMKDNIKHIYKSDTKRAFLTFDDGPSANTESILNILNNYGIKASFFVIGKYVDSHPEIVKRAYEEGHYIANHGYSHNNSILYKSSESFISEVKKTDLAIGKAIGIEDYCSHIFRFPNGFMAPLYKSQKEKAVLLLLEMNYTYIDWNCLNKDSERKYTNTQLLNNLKQSCENKNTLVVLMHDTKDVNNSSLVLKESIDHLRREGYEFRNFYEFVS